MALAAVLGLLLAMSAAAVDLEAPTDGRPVVTSLAIYPDPPMPGPVVVRATAEDDTTWIGFAYIWLGSPGGPPLGTLLAEDGTPDSRNETLVWIGSYDDFPAGWNVLYAQAYDVFLTQGLIAGPFPFFVPDETNIGPSVSDLSVDPSDVDLGGWTTATATVSDPFPNSTVAAAEYFFGPPGPDGTGIPIPGTYGTASANLTWSVSGQPPVGVRLLWVHARNAAGTWGDLRSVGFVARGPAMTLSLELDRPTALRGESVTYALDVENLGNAPATAAHVRLELPASVAYASDTADLVGAVRSGDTYAFADLAPGSYPFEVVAVVDPEAPDDAPLRANAVLEFESAGGWAFPPVSAATTGSVIAPELELWLEGPDVIHAGEYSELVVRFENTGTRTLPHVEVVLPLDPGADRLGDDAGASGGEGIGPDGWQFLNVAPGVHSFTIFERVSPGVADGALATRVVEASYVSRFGDPVRLEAGVEQGVRRPAFALGVTLERATVLAGESVALTIAYDNGGSASARDVWINVTLAPGLTAAAETSPQGPVLRWHFRDVAPGPHALSVLLHGAAPASAALAFELAYTSPGGAPLDRLEATVLVTVQPQPAGGTPPVVAIGLASFAAIAAAFAATERGKTAFLFLTIPLYTRLVREKVLDHETRGMIRGYIIANPGDHYNAIKDTLELPNGTLAYHLSVLEKERLVRSVKDGKFRRFYPYEMRLPEGGEPTKIQKVILDLVRANPGMTPRDAAGLLGLTPSTVSYHLEKLNELKRIEYRRDGISKRLYVRDGNGT